MGEEVKVGDVVVLKSEVMASDREWGTPVPMIVSAVSLAEPKTVCCMYRGPDGSIVEEEGIPVAGLSVYR